MSTIRDWLIGEGAAEVVTLPGVPGARDSIFGYAEDVISERGAQLSNVSVGRRAGAVIELLAEPKQLALLLESSTVLGSIDWPAVPDMVVALVVSPSVPDSQIWGWSRKSGWTKLGRTPK